MEFTKVGKVYINTAAIVSVVDNGPLGLVISFHGGDKLEFRGAAAAHALRAWLADKVIEELPLGDKEQATGS